METLEKLAHLYIILQAQILMTTKKPVWMNYSPNLMFLGSYKHSFALVFLNMRYSLVY